MTASICGADCEKCSFRSECRGCAETDGCPFGEKCLVAECVTGGDGELCYLKNRLMDEFNSLGIKDMDKVTELYALRGSYINLEYKLPGGQVTKLLNDNRIYLGNQLEKKDGDRCCGIAADRDFIMVCEYGMNGSDAELVLFKKIDLH